MDLSGFSPLCGRHLVELRTWCGASTRMFDGVLRTIPSGGLKHRIALRPESFASGDVPHHTKSITPFWTGWRAPVQITLVIPAGKRTVSGSLRKNGCSHDWVTVKLASSTVPVVVGVLANGTNTVFCHIHRHTKTSPLVVYQTSGRPPIPAKTASRVTVPVPTNS